MKKILLLGTLLLSVSAMANEAFECRAGGDLGDIFCWGGKSRAKECAKANCYSANYSNCEVVESTSWKTPMSPFTSCEARVIVQGRD